MKIGFMAYSLFVMERYWEQLRDKADCWWGVTQSEVFEELKKKGIKNVVFCPDEYRYIPEREGNKYVSVAPGKAEAELAARVSPDIWVTDHTNRLTHAAKKALWVQTFHSVCYKKYTFHPLTLQYDLLLLSGGYYRQEFVNRLGFKENDERLKVVGWPRVDDLLQSKHDRNQILQNLGLNPARKTVMYAPTWGGYEKDMLSWGNRLFARWPGRDVEIFELLCSQIEKMGLNFIVKTHHLSVWSNNEVVKNIARKHGALWVTPEMSDFQIDPNPYLWATDVLISDMSGIILDYMVLNRPVIFIDPDESLDAWRECSIPASYRAGEIVQTPEQLLSAVSDSIKNPGKYRTARQEVLSKIFCSLDGKSSERAARAILDLAAARGIA